MKRYSHYTEEIDTDLTDEQLKLVDWTKYKIIVPTNTDKDELQSTFRYLHDEDLETDYITVNQLIHEYLSDNNIIVDKELYNKLNQNNK